MKGTYGRVPMYMLKPASLIADLAAQTLGFKVSCESIHEESRKRDGNHDEKTGLEVFTLKEVEQHDSYTDCWIILYDKVYDVTTFMLEHPGGDELIMDYAGRDATVAFRGVGHSMATIASLDDYLIGILPESQRIFTVDGKSTWSTY